MQDLIAVAPDVALHAGGGVGSCDHRDGERVGAAGRDRELRGRQLNSANGAVLCTLEMKWRITAVGDPEWCRHRGRCRAGGGGGRRLDDRVWADPGLELEGDR